MRYYGMRMLKQVKAEILYKAEVFRMKQSFWQSSYIDNHTHTYPHIYMHEYMHMHIHIYTYLHTHTSFKKSVVSR